MVHNGRLGGAAWELLFPRSPRLPGPIPRVSLLRNPGEESVEAERAGVCKAQVEGYRQPRGFSYSRLTWQQVQLHPRLL